MALPFLSPIQMNQLEILGLRLEQVAGNPGSPVEGQLWYDTATQRVGLRGNAATFKLVRDGGDLTAGSVAIAALAVDPRDRAQHSGTQLAATISNFDTAVRTSRLDQMAAPTASVSLNSQKITNLANGSAASDAAAFGQIQTAIDAALAGLDWKTAVRVATTAAGTLASSFENGDVVDGVTLATGDRILIKDQAAPAENGIYTVNASGAPTRATDANTAALIKDASVLVAEGTTLAGTQWKLTTDNITLGTTGLTWVQHGTGGTAYTAGNGLTLTGNDFNVGAGTGISVAADSVGIDTAVVVRKYTALVGNNSNTTITVNHALGNQWPQVDVYRVSDSQKVMVEAVMTDANNLNLVFAVAPATNAYRVVVQG